MTITMCILMLVFAAFSMIISASHKSIIGYIIGAGLILAVIIILIKWIALNNRYKKEKEERLKNDKKLTQKKEEEKLLQQELKNETIKKQIHDTNNICKYCGSTMINNSCPNCGAKNKD